MLPAYRDIWEAWLRGNNPAWLNAEAALEDPSYYTHLKKYVETHAATYPSMRAALSDERRQRLEEIEGLMASSLTGEEGMEGCVTFAAWHWSCKEWLQEQFWGNWYNPEEGVLYLLFDYKENGTLPQGPSANAAMWRANARLGYTCYGVRAWKRGWSQWFFYLSRCMEHTTAATTTYLDDVWRELAAQLEDVQHIRTWSDGGTHFRSNSFLAYMGTTVPNMLKKDTSVAYGLVSHFKNPCDSEFGCFGARVEELAAAGPLITIADIVAGMQRMGSPHIHKDFFPPPKADVAVERLRRCVLPCGIHASHYWEFKIKDRRRDNMAGRVTAKGRPFTNIAGKALRLPGIGGVPEATFQPELEIHPDDDMEDEDKENDEEDVQEEGGLQIHTKEYLGWRTSWRTIEAEKVCPKKWRKSLKRKFDSMLPVHDRIPLAGRRKTVAAKLMMAAAQRERKRVRLAAGAAVVGA